jgi:hypothetical protein
VLSPRLEECDSARDFGMLDDDCLEKLSLEPMVAHMDGWMSSSRWQAMLWEVARMVPPWKATIIHWSKSQIGWMRIVMSHLTRLRTVARTLIQGPLGCAYIEPKFGTRTNYTT